MLVLRGLLRPLIRALIAHGVTAPTLYKMIKRVYVEVAARDFQLPDQRVTDSRISMLTGVHRRDVKTFRAEKDDGFTQTGEKVTTLASVLGRWIASPDMIDKDGKPLALPRSAATGPSFEALAQSVSRDIRPRTMLDEMIRQDLVTLSEDGVVTLRADAFLGPADLDQKVYFFAENVGDHIAAAADNLLSEEPQYMERAVFYNRLRASSVEKIEAAAREQGSAVLVDLNRMANDLQAEDMETEDGTHRFRFGVFFYREDEDRRDKVDNDKIGGGTDEQS